MDFLSTFFQKFLAVILSFLPKSPFRGFINVISAIPYLEELNWFFPVSECIAVMEAFLTVVAVYYVYSAIMRWVKMIQ